MNVLTQLLCKYQWRLYTSRLIYRPEQTLYLYIIRSNGILLYIYIYYIRIKSYIQYYISRRRDFISEKNIRIALRKSPSSGRVRSNTRIIYRRADANWNFSSPAHAWNIDKDAFVFIFFPHPAHHSYLKPKRDFNIPYLLYYYVLEKYEYIIMRSQITRGNIIFFFFFCNSVEIIIIIIYFFVIKFPSLFDNNIIIIIL